MSNPPCEAFAPSVVNRLPASRPPHAFEVPGPGWSESSWDLARGLTVLEGLPPDASVGEWIVAWLVN